MISFPKELFSSFHSRGRALVCAARQLASEIECMMSDQMRSPMILRSVGYRSKLSGSEARTPPKPEFHARILHSQHSHSYHTHVGHAVFDQAFLPKRAPMGSRIVYLTIALMYSSVKLSHTMWNSPFNCHACGWSSLKMPHARRIRSLNNSVDSQFYVPFSRPPSPSEGRWQGSIFRSVPDRP
jgi:hypothetical protein